jgi:hypothetical protein
MALNFAGKQPMVVAGDERMKWRGPGSKGTPLATFALPGYGDNRIAGPLVPGSNPGVPKVRKPRSRRVFCFLRIVQRARVTTHEASGCDAPGREPWLLKTAKIERHAAGTICRHHCKFHVRIDDEAAVGRPVGNFARSEREPPDV